MIQCIAIEDEPLALKQICLYIDKTPSLVLIGACESATEAYPMMDKHKPDLLFVDINMPDLSGMDFVKSLEKPPMVIFTTAYSQYAVEGYKVDAVDYLLKPISYNDFLRAATKATDLFELRLNQQKIEVKNDSEFLFVKSEYRVVRINFKDILYIEGMREYVRIHLVGHKPVMSLLSMKALEQHLPQDKFMRVHRSYIVNLQKINTIERQRIVYDNDIYIPVSEQFKDKFQKYVDENFLL